MRSPVLKSQPSSASMESLESRQLMAGSVPSSTLSGATSLLISAADQIKTGSINDVSPDDVYRIHLDKASTVYLKLTGLTANGTLELIQDRNCNNRLDSGE